MCEYRAFDKTGVIIDQRDLVDTDSAVAWGITIMVKGAALIERKSGDDWVCFQEFVRGQEGRQGVDSS